MQVVEVGSPLPALPPAGLAYRLASPCLAADSIGQFDHREGWRGLNKGTEGRIKSPRSRAFVRRRQAILAFVGKK